VIGSEEGQFNTLESPVHNRNLSPTRNEFTEQGNRRKALSDEQVPTASSGTEGLSKKPTPVVIRRICKRGHGDIEDRAATSRRSYEPTTSGEV
jgi:hypothetical protein